MFPLLSPSLAVISALPLPKNLKCLPDNFVLKLVVAFASEYPSLIPELNKPKDWSAFKAKVGEQCARLKIADFYPRLYENDEYPSRLMFQFSFMSEAQQKLIDLAGSVGYGDVVRQQVSSVDPERLRDFMVEVAGPFIEGLIESIDEIDQDALAADGNTYWQDIHPTLPPDERQNVEQDAQYFSSLHLYALHNAISIMSYGVALNPLVQQAVFGEPGLERDNAICMSARIDNNLKEHPVYRDRFMLASRDGESKFLLAYNNTNPPLANGVRYRAFYFLLALLDAFGILPRLSNSQLLDLCEQANLDRWGNRIEDEGYLAKRRREYQRHKLAQVSRHSI